MSRPHPPATGTGNVLEQAIEIIGHIRGLDSVDDDPALRLALLIDITRQADARMLDAITAARDHGHSWNHIRRIIGIDP